MKFLSRYYINNMGPSKGPSRGTFIGSLGRHLGGYLEAYKANWRNLVMYQKPLIGQSGDTMKDHLKLSRGSSGTFGGWVIRVMRAPVE